MRRLLTKLLDEPMFYWSGIVTMIVVGICVIAVTGSCECG